MEVYEVGTEVLLDNDIPARITAICIKGVEHRLTYECTWWDERVRKCDWLDPWEITARSDLARKRSLKFMKI